MQRPSKPIGCKSKTNRIRISDVTSRTLLLSQWYDLSIVYSKKKTIIICCVEVWVFVCKMMMCIFYQKICTGHQYTFRSACRCVELWWGFEFFVCIQLVKICHRYVRPKYIPYYHLCTNSLLTKVTIGDFYNTNQQESKEWVDQVEEKPLFNFERTFFAKLRTKFDLRNARKIQNSTHI